MNKTVMPGSRCGEVNIPSSKSLGHRTLICSALGDREVGIRFHGLSKDIHATADCLSALGAEIRMSDGEFRVKPIDRTRRSKKSVLLPTGESGSTLRFLLPVVGALGVRGCFVMEGRLSERPLSPFDRVLSEHGMTVRREGELLYCEGQLQPGCFLLPGNVSSQFFSGLLLALPLLSAESYLNSDGTLESADYIRLTEETLKTSGIRFERNGLPDGIHWQINGSQCPHMPAQSAVEGDWSNAAFFLCAGAISEKGIRVTGLNRKSAQGDRAVLEILREFGAEVEAEEQSVTVKRGNPAPLSIEASAIPDLVPVLAVLCCAAEGKSMITAAARLRLKESDRLSTTSALIRSLGGEAEETEDGLIIHGTGKLRGGSADAFNDHRIAMSAAVAACICKNTVSVRGAECVQKSYPNFWHDFDLLSCETVADTGR